MTNIIDLMESEATIMSEVFIILDAMADSPESLVQIRENLEYYGHNLSMERIVSLLKLMISEEFISVYYNDTEVFENSWFTMTSKGRKYLNDNIDLVK